MPSSQDADLTFQFKLRSEPNEKINIEQIEMPGWYRLRQTRDQCYKK